MRLVALIGTLFIAGCVRRSDAPQEPEPRWQVNRLPDVGPCRGYQIIAPGMLWDRVVLICPDSLRATWENR